MKNSPNSPNITLVSVNGDVVVVKSGFERLGGEPFCSRKVDMNVFHFRL
jgi:hypothetical protein